MFGQFDLDGDGSFEPNGKSQIESLITRWGGNVQDDIDISTNFLVLGMPPQVPSKPQEGADPSTIDAYNTRQRQFDKWTSLRDRAERQTLLILNTDTFLHYIGYYNDDHKPGWKNRVRPGEDYFPGS